MSSIPWTDGWNQASPAPRATISTAAATATAMTLARVVGIAPAVALDLLARYGSLAALQRVDASTLRTANGLTRRQAERLRDALALATSLLLEPRDERPRVSNPRDAACLVLPEMGLLEQEQVRLLLLDTRHHLIAAVTLYTGTICECRVRVAEVFREAVRRNASALILAHNHPSGVVEPSPEDISLTRDVVQAGRLLDVDLLDHLVVTRDGYASLRERGVGWE